MPIVVTCRSSLGCPDVLHSPDLIISAVELLVLVQTPSPDSLCLLVVPSLSQILGLKIWLIFYRVVSGSGGEDGLGSQKDLNSYPGAKAQQLWIVVNTQQHPPTHTHTHI